MTKQSKAKILLTAVLCIGLAACGNSQKKHTENKQGDSVRLSEKQVSADSPQLSERKKIVNELKKFRSAFDKNKIAIADYIHFPVEEDVIRPFDINPSFDSEYESNGHLITEEMFEQNFERLYEYFQIDCIGKLFDALPLDNLLSQDEISCKTQFSDGIYCFAINIEEDEVTLMFGPASDDEDAPYQYDSFWTFTFDGQKLWLTKQETVG